MESWLLFNLFFSHAPIYAATEFLAMQKCTEQAVISPVSLELVYKYFIFATGALITEKKTNQKSKPNKLKKKKNSHQAKTHRP